MSQDLPRPGPDARVHRFSTARRTISETDIVNFVNLVGLHEPIFADMEYVKEHMPESHRRRFSPSPMLISMGMGLVAPHVMGWMEEVLKDEKVGFVGGLTGLVASVKKPVYPGDTIRVELSVWIRGKTSRGHTLIDLRHEILNQRGETVVDFVETVLYTPPAD